MKKITIGLNLVIILSLVLGNLLFPRYGISAEIKQAPEELKACLDRAYNYFREGQLDLAITQFDKAIKMDSSNPNYYNDRGTCYMHKRDFKKAIADISKAIEMNSRDG